MRDEARFELEQAIIACGNINDDIELLMEALLDANADKDRIANAIVGIRELHEMRCNRAFNIFAAMIRDGLIA